MITKNKSVRKKSSKKSALRGTILTDKDIAMDFAVKAHKRFESVIKASVLFGSQAMAKSNATVGSDIDIILIVDDAAVNWDIELVAWYREELGKLISEQDYGKTLHINTVRLTTWWNDLQHGDPVVVNILRYGDALIDIGGFFSPLKILLQMGRIRSTPEAVYAALSRAPGHIARSKMAEVGAIEGAYWAMVDSAQAALMTFGKMPPSPERIPQMLRETFVDKDLLKMSYVRAMNDLLQLHKSVQHGEITDIKGQDLDKWQDLAEKFFAEMTSIINSYLDNKSR